MTDSRNDIGAPYPARRGMADREPNLHWQVRCLHCHAAGMFFHEVEAHDWAEHHRCPPKDAEQAPG